MELNKNPTQSIPAQKQEKKRKPLTEEQRRKRKKLLVYPLMALLFAGSMWLIFAPSANKKEKEQLGKGFNTDMPLPKESGIIADKRTAYEQARMEDKQQERSRSMQGLSDLFGKETQGEQTDDYKLKPVKASDKPAYGSNGGSDQPEQAVQSSTTAYRNMNRTLDTFYEPLRKDAEKEDLKERVEELEQQLATQQKPSTTMDDQLALLEKSYELAAKYMPAGQNESTFSISAEPARAEKKRAGNTMNGKIIASPVKQVTMQIVSALSQHVSNEELIAKYSKERNYDFQTAVGTEVLADKNTITACIHTNQTITNGQSVRLRLLEPMDVEGMQIPRNTVVVGKTQIQGERLGIEISSLECQGTIIPVKLSVFDNDGQAGIYIPDSQEISGAKDVAANMGSSLGSSINISTDAGAQLASDLGKSLIQGTSQYIAKKMRAVKVHLKAGYRVMLYQEEN
ncbi:conjugative transposon protein TraM [Bacteroides graminisolvens]|uniref:conjugative transposon protein TraM n=1 Tax=Bacteroides graminisolvens TaxID=477666 RepID=UPI00240A3F5F|nr:conjugative transposon protein TraM [Bacteroides graminisolvens]